MKKIKIFYFSGTGNTYYIVEQLSKHLTSLGNTVALSSCESCDVDIDEFDMIGIAFPIHTSCAPVVFEELLKELPSTNDKPLFGVVTSGYMAGDVLYHYNKLLNEKGYQPFLYQNFVVGNNLHLPYLSPLRVLREDKKQKKRENLNKRVEDIANKIHNEELSLKGNDVFSKIFGYSQRSIGKVHEKVNFKGFDTDETCVKCMWCIKNCPVDNIYFDNEKVKFSNNCIMCMRCYNFCPIESIQCTKHTKNKKKYKRYSGINSLKSQSKFN